MGDFDQQNVHDVVPLVLLQKKLNHRHQIELLVVHSQVADIAH
jgi:hypothetical protein